MKKWGSKMILILLCAIISAETLYIATFPCTWGYSLYVDEVFIGSLKDQNQLTKLLEDIKEPYITENTRSCEFFENITIEKEKFLKKQLTTFTPEQIASKLTANKEVATLYTVRRGDTWSEIAEKHGQTSKELLALNPGYNINKLKIGDKLIISPTIPYLSVVTTEQQTYIDDLPYDITYVDNGISFIGSNYCRILQPGKCGTAEVTATITYLNGRETNRKIISSVMIVEPVDEIRQIISNE